MRGRVYVVGIGPGDYRMMTEEADEILKGCDTIVGYRTYTDLIRDRYPDREIIENGMKGETERCRIVIREAVSGKTVALICSGDAGIYGMASPLLEIADQEGFDDIVIVPGVTAALSGAAILGAPLGHDACLISLSDLLTPWERIEKRLRCAAEGDFCIAIYNPASSKRTDHLKRACDILLSVISPETVCGYVRNIGREGTAKKICTLKELREEPVDMFTTVFIGNSATRKKNGWLITPRGYHV